MTTIRLHEISTTVRKVDQYLIILLAPDMGFRGRYQAILKSGGRQGHVVKLVMIILQDQDKVP